MATSNEQIFDAAVRRQVNLQRFSKQEARKFIKTLNEADRELAKAITKRAGGLAANDFTTKRWQAMRTEIGRIRRSALRSIGKDLTEDLADLAVLEADFAAASLSRAVPVELNFATPAPAQLRAIATERAFGGAEVARTVTEWFVDLEQADTGRIMGQIQAGIAQGETMPQIQRRVSQVTDLTRQNAEAITRTGINGVSNAAREEFFRENDDVILGLRWTSTLDGRTSAICRARDGHFAPVGEGSNENLPEPRIAGTPTRPPAHVGCRSLMVAVLDSDGVADKMPERPTVRDARTRRQREIDFRKEAKASVGKKEWSRMSRDERNELIRARRREWARENVGMVPGETTYDEWLRRQDKEFQNEVLGPTKAKKFREGTRMDQFVDHSGRELTIDELEDVSPAGPAAAADRQMAKARRLDQKAKAAEARAARARAQEAEAATKAAREEAEAQRLRQAQLQNRTVDAEEVDDLVRERALKDNDFAHSLPAEQQDVIFGPERAEFLRRGAAVEQVALPDGSLRSVDELVDDFPRHIRQTGATWSPTKQDRWASSLTDDEIEGIRTYVGESTAIKRYQEGRPLDSLYYKKPDKRRLPIDQASDAFESALEKAPVYDGDLWRGAAYTPEKIQEVIEAGGRRTRSVTSFTPRSASAWDFASGSVRKSKEHTVPVMMRVRGQKSGKMIMDYGVELEAEVVVPGGVEYRITETHDMGTYWVFEMEEVQ